MSPQPSPFALIPIYHWRGARPPILDLDQDQQGSLVALLLTRQGDCCLLPIRWQYSELQPDPDPFQPFLPLEDKTVDRSALELVLHDLAADGWEMQGQLTFHYAGIHTPGPYWPDHLPRP